MALEMRETCERCGGALGLGSDAFVCSYECTFCPACADGMSLTCPNCGGELVRRPRRREARVTPRALVRRLHEIWNTGDLGAVDEVYAEDFVGHFPPSSHLPDRRGRDGAREGIRRAKIAFPDWHEGVEAMVTEGNVVVTRYTSTGTHRGEFRGLPGVRPTGRTITVPEISIYRVARGRVAEQWCLLDELGRLQQLGASVEPPPRA
jgi:steroid delta-isomerase-like uncharacterized protein